MTKATVLRSYLKESFDKNSAELNYLLAKESQEGLKVRLEIMRGRSGQTHLVKRQRKKIALLQTLLSQKRILGESS